MLNFNELLEPISEASPSGEDLTFSGEVDAINQARKFDDPLLDQGEWVVALKEADWDFVYDNCAVLLAEKTKDMRLAAWLAEAASKTRQFEGLAAGFELLGGLSERYWETLYPSMEEEDIEQRVGNLAWLLARSVQLVKEIPLTEGRGSAYSWMDFEAARARANTALRTGESVIASEARPDISVLESARRKSSRAFYSNLHSSAVHCQEMLTQLEVTMDERLGAEGPSFRSLKDTLGTVLATVERYAADVGITAAGAAPTPADKKMDVAVDSKKVSHPEVVADTFVGGISNRTQALEQLRLVAEFFRRTEPHSPVAYLADKAAHWGDLPLHEWLKAVVKDAGSLASIQEMLGVKSGDSLD